jgi:hypothetical protein
MRGKKKKKLKGKYTWKEGRMVGKEGTTHSGDPILRQRGLGQGGVTATGRTIPPTPPPPRQASQPTTTNYRQTGRGLMRSMDGGWAFETRENMRKGLYEFQDNPTAKVSPLPAEFLPEYLAAFCEEAYEHERRECAHLGMQPKADQDLHDWWAQRVFGELLQYMRKNKDLARAAKNTTYKDIAMILRTKGIVQPESKSYIPTDRDAMTAMGVNAVVMGERLEYSRTRRGDFEEPLDKAVGLTLAPKAFTPANVVDDSRDPFGDVAGLLKARMAQIAVVQAQEWRPSVSHDCPIHGMGDLTKMMNLQHSWGKCACS